MKQTAVVLFSGGQDSTTSLFWARAKYERVVAVSIDYGQRHASELEAAKEIARVACVPRVVLTLPALAEIGDSALVDKSKALTSGGGRADVAMPEGLPSSFVPGRNLLFFAMAAAVAVREGARTIVSGVCQTDYSGYPDCRREFVDAFEKAVTLAMPSSAGPIEVATPLMYMTKAETVQLARSLPGCWDALAISVTCYDGKRQGCGVCPACNLRAAGFRDAGEGDPAANGGGGE